MSRLLFAILFLTLFVVPAFSQIACIPMGSLTPCSGPGVDQTQVPLGPNTGVIITDQATTPYTILSPNQARPFNPAPLPTLPRASTLQSPASPQGNGMNPMFLPGPGPAVILGR